MTNSSKSSKKSKISLVPVKPIRKPISIAPAAIAPEGTTTGIGGNTLTREELLSQIPASLIESYLQKKSQAPQPIMPVTVSAVSTPELRQLKEIDKWSQDLSESSDFFSDQTLPIHSASSPIPKSFSPIPSDAHTIGKIKPHTIQVMTPIQRNTQEYPVIPDIPMMTEASPHLPSSNISASPSRIWSSSHAPSYQESLSPSPLKEEVKPKSFFTMNTSNHDFEQELFIGNRDFKQTRPDHIVPTKSAIPEVQSPLEEVAQDVLSFDFDFDEKLLAIETPTTMYHQYDQQNDQQNDVIFSSSSAQAKTPLRVEDIPVQLPAQGLLNDLNLNPPPMVTQQPPPTSPQFDSQIFTITFDGQPIIEGLPSLDVYGDTLFAKKIPKQEQEPQFIPNTAVAQEDFQILPPSAQSTTVSLSIQENGQSSESKPTNIIPQSAIHTVMTPATEQAQSIPQSAIHTVMTPATEQAQSIPQSAIHTLMTPNADKAQPSWEPPSIPFNEGLLKTMGAPAIAPEMDDDLFDRFDSIEGFDSNIDLIQVEQYESVAQAKKPISPEIISEAQQTIASANALQLPDIHQTAKTAMEPNASVLDLEIDHALDQIPIPPQPQSSIPTINTQPNTYTHASSVQLDQHVQIHDPKLQGEENLPVHTIKTISAGNEAERSLQGQAAKAASFYQNKASKPSAIPTINFNKVNPILEKSKSEAKSESWEISAEIEGIPGFKASDRYKIGNEIAQGGVGKILLVYDKLLKRQLVMKTLKKTQSSRHVKRLLEEALISAQLQHPNIVPIHDVGILESGEYFFTMKLIVGKSLKSILRSLKQDPSLIKDYPLFKLLGYFKQICLAMSFAHNQKIIHRDLKPSNVMIGDFGEVLVVDWGIAKRLGDQHRSEFEESMHGFHDESLDESIESDEMSTSEFQVKMQKQENQSKAAFKNDLTQQGTITGTLSYMSPEQARGDSRFADERTDIYALGAILYEILCYRPPFRGKDTKKVIHHILYEALIPPSQLTQTILPPMLEAMCVKALHKKPEERYQSVKEMIDELDIYLSLVEEFDQRSKIAQEKYKQSQQLFQEYRKILKEKKQVESDLIEFNYQIPVFAPVEKRKQLWQKKAELNQKEIEYFHSYSSLEQILNEIIALNPSFDDALDDLSELYKQRLEEAELLNLEEQTIYFRDAIKRLNREQHKDLFVRKGGLQLRTLPSKANVYATRYLEVDLIKRPLKEISLGQSPITQSQHIEGTWRLRIEANGYRDVIHHVLIKSGQITDASIPFYTEEEIGKYFVYVPQGTFSFGGDVLTRDDISTQKQIQQNGFFISKYLVTVKEYLDFIRYIDEIDPKEAQARVPRLRALGGYLWHRNRNGKFDLPNTASDVEAMSKIEGMPSMEELGQLNLNWSLKWPVFGISFADANRFCWWYRRVRGIDVRLPTEYEWEKAARGTDARLFPWGNDFDASFCHTAEGRNGIVAPVNVASYSKDISPYGLYDMAGLVQEYCDSNYQQNQQIKVLKGGSFESYHAWQCRTHHREGIYMYATKLGAGFRLARSLPR